MTDLSVALLFVTVVCVQTGLGALLTLSFRRTVRADWIDEEKATLIKIARLLYLAPLLFTLLYLNRHALYPWSRGEGPPGAFAQFYFSTGFFLIRNAAVSAVWCVLGYRLGADKQASGAGPMLLIFFTATFAAFDWILALDPHWKSTAFGVIFVASGLLASHGLSLSLLKRAPPEKTLIDLNTIHFVLIGAWTYLSLMQFLIIWSGNLPDEVTLYTYRLQSDWKWIPRVLVSVQFAGLMFSLLFRPLKKSLRFTRGAGGLTFILQGAFAYWLIAPTFHQGGPALPPVMGVAIAGIGMAWWGFHRRLA